MALNQKTEVPGHNDVVRLYSHFSSSTSREDVDKTLVHRPKQLADAALSDRMQEQIKNRTYGVDSPDDNEHHDNDINLDLYVAAANYDESDDQDSDEAADFESETEEDPDNRKLTEEEFKKAEVAGFLTHHARDRYAERLEEIIVRVKRNNRKYRKMNDAELLQAGTVMPEDHGGRYMLIADPEGTLVRRDDGNYTELSTRSVFALVNDGEGVDSLIVQRIKTQLGHSRRD